MTYSLPAQDSERSKGNKNLKNENPFGFKNIKGEIGYDKNMKMR